MFKEYLEADLDCFFNTDEFAEQHTIDGVEMDVVVDDDMLKERWQSRQDIDDPAGYFESNVLFHVKKTDFGEKPAPGQRITFDGVLYEVAEAVENGGIYTITLGARLS